jgi:hypothetical protein
MNSKVKKSGLIAMKTKFAEWLLLSFMTITLSAQDAAKYELESAIVQKEITMMGQKLNATWYMDGFGRKESVEMTIKNGIAQGVDKHIRTLTEGASVITIDLDLNVGNRMELPEKPVNYLQLTPEIREKYKIREGGEEEIAGKKCRKYSLEVTQMGQTLLVTAWVWKGLVLKSESAGNGMVFAVETATEVQENAAVPADKFVVPENAIIQK